MKSFGLGFGICFCLFFLVGCDRHPNSFSPKESSGQHDRDGIRHAEHGHDLARIGTVPSPAISDIDVLKYKLAGVMDWSARTLHVTLNIRVRILKPSLSKIVLDSYVTDVKDIVLTNNDPLSFTETPGKLEIPIDSIDKVTLASPLELRIRYSVKTDSLPNGNPSALVSVLPRRGDPNPSRIVYSFSEPHGAAEWMPCHNDPRDRAVFETDFLMEPQEQLISNGALTFDQIENGKRHMRYATSYTLPTYLMAFAVGEFTTYHRMHGKLPLSLWVRKGIPTEGDKMLEELDKMVTHLESLLTPFPFEKYALVLVPEFPSGGLENASITFQSEVLSTQPRFGTDLGLSAHELAHQWFGDFVTVDTWDDLWIKEGMASLLGEEASREYEDRNGSNRLMGIVFGPKDGHAIRDKSLAPDDKYTTGPYDRAAWWLTQVRSAIGDKAFWSTLRNVLRDHAFGNISTDEFVEAFRPHLGEARYLKAKAAIDAKALPSWEIKDSKDHSLAIHLHDKEHTIFADLDLAVHSPSGKTVFPVPLNTTLEIDIPLQGYISLDSTDSHALAAFEDEDDSFSKKLSPKLVPPKNSLGEFLKLPANAQALAFLNGDAWELEPTEITDVVNGISADSVKFSALQKICEIAKRRTSPAGIAAWAAPIESLVLHSPFYGVPGRAPKAGFAACTDFLGTDVFRIWWIALKSGLTSPYVSESLLIFLSSIPQSPSEALQTWEPVIRNASSIRSQLTALRALLRHTNPEGKFAHVTPADRDGYRDAFRRTLAENESAEVTGLALEGMIQMKDSDSLPLVAKAIRSSARPWFQLDAVCAAHRLAKDHPDFWDSFLKEMGDLSGLSDRLRNTIQNPQVKCNY